MRTQIKHVGDSHYSPRIQIISRSLEDIGFFEDVLAVAEYVNECIVIKINDEDIESYSELVKQVRENDSKLIQVGSVFEKEKLVPTISIIGNWLSKHGFAPCDKIIVNYEYGVIRIKKLDCSKIVF